MRSAGLLGALALAAAALAFAAPTPPARSATPVEMRAADRSGDLPLHWVQQALSDMPFLTPGRE
jgi:hypothetical protein